MYASILSPPISGAWSAYLWADWQFSTSIWQVGTIPPMAEQLLFDYNHLDPWPYWSDWWPLTVSINGQTVGSTSPIDVSAYAGETVELRFTVSGPGNPSIPEYLAVVGLDNIRFYGVPEPTSSVLFGLGSLAFVIGTRRKCCEHSLPNPPTS